MILQYIILIIILIGVAIYVIVKIRKSNENRKRGINTCSGCSLKDCCTGTANERAKKCSSEIAQLKK